MTREEAIEHLKEWREVISSGHRKAVIDMAIEALSAEPSDLISRADAIDTINELEEKINGETDNNVHTIATCDVLRRIKALPSADAETKYIAQIKVDTEEIVRRIKEEYDITDGWIPCSERLPKEKQEVYVTVYFIEGDTGRAYGYMDGFGRWHLYSTVEGTLNSGYEVTAWMPLPEPFEGGEKE